MLKPIITALDRVKSEDIIIYDMKGVSPLFDNIIIATVSSQRQASSVCDYIEDELVEAGFDVRNVEGKNTAWVVVDCHDVLVHVFTREEREHYNLEKIYMDVPTIDVEQFRDSK
jgi:ribosome-associated protein